MAGKRTNGSEAGFAGDQNPDDELPIVGTSGEPDSSDGIPIIEPATIIGSSSGDGAPRGRGRPRGSRTASSPSKSKPKEGKQDLTIILLGLHSMAAAFTKVEELELSEKEAKLLSDNIAAVNELYGGIVVPEKVQAWLNLTFAAGSVYGPRIVAHKLRMKKEAEQKKRGEPVTINSQQQKVH